MGSGVLDAGFGYFHTPDGKWEFLNPQPACLLNSDNRSARWLTNANVSAGRFSIRSGDNKPCGHTGAPETIGMSWGCGWGWVGGGRGSQRKPKDTSSNQPCTRDFTAREYTLTLRAKCCRLQILGSPLQWGVPLTPRTELEQGRCRQDASGDLEKAWPLYSGEKI